MTQDEKDILIKDLCARLSYGVKVRYKYYPINITEKFATSIRLADDKLALSSKLNKEGDWYPIEEAGEILIKPYLFPLSSMTEEQLFELRKIFGFEIEFNNGFIELSTFYRNKLGYLEMDAMFEWFNKNHFDYRGLIKKGLAIDATGLNIY